MGTIRASLDKMLIQAPLNGWNGRVLVWEKENDEEAPDKDNDNSKKGDNMNTTPNENPSEQEPPQLNEAHFNYTDIADAIDQLSLCSGPGPDGISAISVKDYSVIDVE